MTLRNLFVAILVVSLLNGFLSPMTKLVFLLAPLWMPGFLPATLPVLFHGAVIFVAVGTLLLAGVPAALLERVSRRPASDRTSMAVWLGAAILLTLPGLLTLSSPR